MGRHPPKTQSAGDVLIVRKFRNSNFNATVLLLLRSRTTTLRQINANVMNIAEAPQNHAACRNSHGNNRING